MEYFLILFMCTMYAGATYYEGCDQIEDDGFYCHSDLSGYDKCVYEEPDWDFYLAKASVTKCSTGTRCSCYIDDWCKMNESAICVPYESPAPFVGSYSMKYHYKKLFESLYPEYDPTYTEHYYGEMVRDQLQGKFYKKEGNSVELVLRRADNKFTKYHWHTDKNNTCSNSTMNYLPTFSIDIHKYTLKSSTKTGNKVTQKWYFQSGRDSWAYEFKKHWWTMLYDPNTHEITPVRYDYSLVDVDMADYNFYEDIKWTHHNSTEMKHGNWFDLPQDCKQ